MNTALVTAIAALAVHRARVVMRAHAVVETEQQLGDVLQMEGEVRRMDVSDAKQLKALEDENRHRLIPILARHVRLRRACRGTGTFPCLQTSPDQISTSRPTSTTCEVGTPKYAAGRLALRCIAANSSFLHIAIPAMLGPRDNHHPAEIIGDLLRIDVA